VKCWLPEQRVKVYFDGTHVNVKMSPMYMGRQCGICGNMDFDPENEFTKTDSDSEFNEPEYDTRKAFHTYTLQDEKCQRPQTSAEMCDDDECDYDQEAFPRDYRGKSRKNSADIDASYDMPDEFDFRSEIRPINKKRVIERNGKRCVSKQSLPTCPEHTYPAEIKETKQVEFICKRPRTSWYDTFDYSQSQESQSQEYDDDENNNNSQESTEQSTGGRRQKSREQQLTQRNSQQQRSQSQSQESGSSGDSSSQSMEQTGQELTMTVRIPTKCRRM
jgi:hypothetical protein